MLDRPARHRPARSQAGIALVEALLAFVLLALGVLAATQVQAHLRQAADNARQRSEALRLAQQDIEQQRAFADDAAYAAIAGANLSVDGDTTSYALSRQVDGFGAARLKTLTVTVTWTDRRGLGQHLTLHTALAGTPPALSGALGLAPAAPLITAP